MHVNRYGRPDGPLLVLLHGEGLAGWMWRRQVEALGTDFDLLVPDLPGHAGSADQRFVSVAETADRVADLVEQVRADREVVVAGFSLGGQVALELAARHRVDRVVVVSALLQPPAWARVVRPWAMSVAVRLNRFDGVLTRQGAHHALPADMLDDYRRTSASLRARDVVPMMRSVTSYALPVEWSSTSMPALVMAGGEERHEVLESVRQLGDLRRGVVTHVVAGAGHGLPHERPAEFEDTLRAWLAG